jgi:hypothetical protein
VCDQRVTTLPAWFASTNACNVTGFPNGSGIFDGYSSSICWQNDDQLGWCFDGVGIDSSILAMNMKTKLELYQTKLVQLPAIAAGYLNPKIPKPSDRAGQNPCCAEGTLC